VRRLTGRVRSLISVTPLGTHERHEPTDRQKTEEREGGPEP
jgi:hypothetical protein